MRPRQEDRPSRRRDITPEDSTSQRADLEKAVRTSGGLWDTERGPHAMHDTWHDPHPKHTRRILRDLATEGLLVKVEDWPVRYRVVRTGCRVTPPTTGETGISGDVLPERQHWACAC